MATTLTPLAAMAARLQINAAELEPIIKATVMPAKDASGNKLIVSNEQFISFLTVANAYGLDPLKKEIFAFPAKGGGIQPVVSIDGWLSIINAHSQFDGMELTENYNDDGAFLSVTCAIYRKDRSRPTVVTECLDECVRKTEAWNKPKRMMRHKAAIQCSRYAFGLSGIVELDEAEAALDSRNEREIGPASSALVSDVARARQDTQRTAIDSPAISDAHPVAGVAYKVFDPFAATESHATAPVLYADIAALINAADTPESLSTAKTAMMDFCAADENTQYQKELGGLYRLRLQNLKKGENKDY